MSNSFQFDGYRAIQHLERRYAEYLTEMFDIRDSRLAETLRGFWRGEGESPFALFAPMLVEGTFPYRPKAPASALECPTPAAKQRDPDRPLHPNTVRLLTDAGIDYSFYEHQTEAFSAAAQGQSIILSAGTGSGKTEAFLIPLIDRMFWDQEQGLDDLSQPGVRALIIYPLNALVNSQVERLLSILRSQDGSTPSITFAYYTSRLQENYSRARNHYQATFETMPSSCQIIDRETLRGHGKGPVTGPPHILVTNFSMLEYMLIRKADASIFEPRHSRYRGKPRLKMMVLDEAHVYSGAMADEIHLLLRRAARKFGTSLDNIQGFATSATISSTANAGGQIEPLVNYACAMFRKRREQVKAIVAHSYLPSTPTSIALPTPGLFEPCQTQDDIIPRYFATMNAAGEFLRDPEMCSHAWNVLRALNLVSAPAIPQALLEEVNDTPALLLWHVVSQHPKTRALRKFLFDRGQARLPSLDETARFLYEDRETIDESSRKSTEALLRTCSMARREPQTKPYIPVRLHLVMRSPSGLWAEPGSKLLPDHEDDYPHRLFASPPEQPNDDSPRLEVRYCEHCGELFLMASATTDDFGDDELHVPGAVDDGKPVALRFAADAGFHLPPTWGNAPVEVLPVETDKPNDVVQCPRCKRRSQLKTFSLDSRQSTDVIVDTIYEELAERPGRESNPGGGRQMMTFSDSRRSTAQVAVRLERNHDLWLKRAAIYQVLAEQARPVKHAVLLEELQENKTLLQLSDVLRLRQSNENDDDDAITDFCTLAIMEEFGSWSQRRLNLENLALVQVVYPNLPSAPPDATMFTDNEWADLLSCVLDEVRRSGAVRPQKLHSDWARSQGYQDDLPRGLGKKFMLARSKTRTQTDDDDQEYTALIPSVGYEQRHRIFAFLSAVSRNKSITAHELATMIFQALMVGQPTLRWLRRDDDSLQLDLRPLSFVARPDGPAFWDERLRRAVTRQCCGVGAGLPTAEDVRPITNRERWRQRASVRRVQHGTNLGMLTFEHSAQLASEQLSQQERAFRLGKANLMASSTTMELGVDIGGLTFVLMSNVPPGPGNYLQRSGRAGRRADGSSLVLTLALHRPHDQRVFAQQREFLGGTIHAPKVRLRAEPIVQRHVNAFLLTHYVQVVAEQRPSDGNPMGAFGRCGAFFGVDPESKRLSDENVAGFEFIDWLDQGTFDKECSDGCQVIVEGTCLQQRPVADLAKECLSQIRKIIGLFRDDFGALDYQQTKESNKKHPAKDKLEGIAWQKSVLERDQLIRYLAVNRFLPSLGFPVDIVSLHTRWQRDSSTPFGQNHGKESSELRLERPLALALNEYVPGAEIIADKRIYRSAGIVPNWYIDENKADIHYMSECPRCGHTTFRHAPFEECELCGAPVQDYAPRAENKSRRRARPVGPADENAPGMLYWYMKPRNFSVQFGQRPKHVTRSPSAGYGAQASINVNGRYDVIPCAGPDVLIGYAPNSTLFISSKGPEASKRSGYAICQVCGRAEAEDGEKSSTLPPTTLVRHNDLRSKTKCQHKGQLWRNMMLGHDVTVDAFRMRFVRNSVPSHAGTAFYETLAVVMSQVAAEMLVVDSRTFKPAVAAFRNEGGFQREAVIYDESCSGMLRQVEEQPTAFFDQLVTLLSNTNLSHFIRFENQHFFGKGTHQLSRVREHLRKLAASTRSPST